MKKDASAIIEVTYRDVERTPAMDSLIDADTKKLYKVFSHISSCRMTVEKSQKHQTGGRPYSVRLDITVPPRHEIVVKKGQAGEDPRAELPHIIKEAFLAARRQLEDLKEKQRGEVKAHEW